MVYQKRHVNGWAENVSSLYIFKQVLWDGKQILSSDMQVVQYTGQRTAILILRRTIGDLHLSLKRIVIVKKTPRRRHN